MESVYQEKSKFRMSKRKALVITLSLLAVALIVSEPVYASVPWYITGIGAIAGGIIGSLTGSPIGTIAGAAAGAMIAGYLYDITHKVNSSPYYFPNQQMIENEFASSYLNLTDQEMINDVNQAHTTISLFTEDYYYNAQQQEALVPYFLPNSSLNQFNISLASGTFATINNISNSIFSPVDTVLWQTFYDGTISGNNGFTTDQVGQTYGYARGDTEANCQFKMNGLEIYGSQLTKGDYVFIHPQNVSTTIFKFELGLAYLNVSNFYTGKTYNISSNAVLPLNSSSIPYGFYKINSVSSNLLTTGIQVLPSGAIDTTLSTGLTGYIVSPGGYKLAIRPNQIFVNTSFFSSMGVTLYDSSNIVCQNPSAYNGQKPGTYSDFCADVQFSGMQNYYASLSSNLNNTFAAANSYFNTLHSLGYTNINQLPANQIIPFPSDVVPSSMLNGTFNACELDEMYISYLNDLNNTFHNPYLFNGKNFTKYVNQSMFVNGFLTIYGNLTYNNSGTITHIDNTDFFIQTYTNKLHFVKGQTTNLTGEIYPVLILNGSQNGTLLYVDASIYVINLQLAGKNITSYTLEPEQITYVLPQTVNVGAPNTNGFLTSASNFLDKYYLYVAVIIVSALVIFVYSESRKNAGKGKE